MIAGPQILSAISARRELAANSLRTSRRRALDHRDRHRRATARQRRSPAPTTRRRIVLVLLVVAAIHMFVTRATSSRQVDGQARTAARDSRPLGFLLLGRLPDRHPHVGRGRRLPQQPRRSLVALLVHRLTRLRPLAARAGDGQLREASGLDAATGSSRRSCGAHRLAVLTSAAPAVRSRDREDLLARAGAVDQGDVGALLRRARSTTACRSAPREQRAARAAAADRLELQPVGPRGCCGRRAACLPRRSRGSRGPRCASAAGSTSRASVASPPSSALDDHVLAPGRARVDEPVVVEARTAELDAAARRGRASAAGRGSPGSATLRARMKSRPSRRARQTTQCREIATASAPARRDAADLGAGPWPRGSLIRPAAITAIRPSPSAGSWPGQRGVVARRGGGSRGRPGAGRRRRSPPSDGSAAGLGLGVRGAGRDGDDQRRRRRRAARARRRSESRGRSPAGSAIASVIAIPASRSAIGAISAIGSARPIPNASPTATPDRRLADARRRSRRARRRRR